MMLLSGFPCITILLIICGSRAEAQPKANEKISTNSPSLTTEPAIARPTEIHSSFSEDVNEGQPLDVDSTILQKIKLNPNLSETVEEIVLSLTGSSSHEEDGNSSDVRNVTPETKTEFEATPAPSDVTEVLEAPNNETTEPTPTVRVAPEDIPSFSEWSQQQLAEINKAGPNVTERVRVTKIRNKNYASPDCGAKIVAANAEAVSSSSVLTSSRDEYMLNHCTSRIWFIVELCEAIQAKQIDLANFELFSSSPKEFSVLLGTRFPSRDWTAVGRFTALDSRDIQTFDLNPHLFGKFLKLEVHSHYGKEHYCPLSWVRVFGTSEYEVLATEDERHGDDDDDLADEEAGETPKNLFSSATDAVLSIVKKATAPFLKSEELTQSDESPPSMCVSPRYLTVCNDCSQHVYDNVFYLLSCQQDVLFQFILTPYVRWILLQTETCMDYGLNFASLRGAPYPLRQKPDHTHYLTALLKESYIAALCNAMAVIEHRVVVNMSLASPSRNLTVEPSPAPPTSILAHSATCDAPNYSTSITTQDTTTRGFPYQIRPTKTLAEEDAKKLAQEGDTTSHSEFTTATPSGSGTPSVAAASVTLVPGPTNDSPKISFVEKVEEDEAREDGSLDAILKDLKELEQVVREQPAVTTSSTPPPGSPKDSIFLRLANRIKALELNMSLSSSYLEELSRRYRLQFELLGQTVNATAMRLEQQIKIEELRGRRREEEMSTIRNQLEKITSELQKLSAERDSWLPRPSQLIWLFIELTILWYYFRRPRPVPPPDISAPDHKSQASQVKGQRRRNSVECVTGHIMPVRALERRPSDEALEITVSTIYTSSDRKRRKKRKDSSRKSSAVAVKRKKSETPNSVSEEREDEVRVSRQLSEPPAATTSGVVQPSATTPTREAVATSNRFAAFASPDPPPRLIRRFSSPAFMRTAMSSRVSRSAGNSLQDEVTKLTNKKESGFKKYMKKLF